MGRLEDDENRNDNHSRKSNLSVDLGYVAPQRIDSQFCPDGVLEGDGAYDSPYLTNTMPVDDTCLLEDAFETQLVDLAGETQVLDDLDCMNDIPIELLNQFNAEAGTVSECDGTNETEALCETQVLCQDDSVRIDGNGAVGLEDNIANYHLKEASNVSEVPSETYTNEERNSGSVCREFTSIRAASIRASGLAARAQGANGNFFSTSSDKSSAEQKPCEQDGSYPVGYLLKSSNEYNEHGGELKNLNKCKVGGTAMRKLFREDKVSEVGQSEADIKNADDALNILELPASEDCLAGLSYCNSQEPGELSQAHALEVVDRFLDLNVIEYDKGFGTQVHHAEKPKVVSVAKGSRDLAKSSTLKSTDGEHGIYDWDDTREDDGGGEFFLKKKEFFFDKGGPLRGCLTEPRKRRSPDLGSVKAVRDNGDEKEQYTKNKLGDTFHSDSGLMVHKLRAKEKPLYHGEDGFHKNLTKDLDEQLNVVSGPKSADNDTDKDVPDMGIGPDTQMAAEAMETLCFQAHLAGSNSNGPDEGAHGMTKATKKNQSGNRLAHSEKLLTPQVPYPATVGVVTRQAKQMKRTNNESSLSSKQSKRIRKKHDRVQGEAEQRRLAYHGMESTGERSEKKHHLEEQPEFSESVAHRTRKCAELNRLKADGNDNREEIKDLISARVLRKRTTTSLRNAEIVTIEKVRKLGSIGIKQLRKTFGTSRASSIDAVDNPRGKRSRRATLSVGHGAETRSSGRLKRSRETAASTSSNPSRNHSNPSPTCDGAALSSLDTQSGNILLHHTVANKSTRNGAVIRASDKVNTMASLNDGVGASTSNQRDKKSDAEPSAEGAETNGVLEASPRERCGTSFPTSATPAACATSVNNVSPICMGDEYHRQSCKKNLSRLSLMKELNDLVASTPGPYSAGKDSRKRKDITNIRVLFSQHLDMDIVKQQKKILARLGGAVVSSMTDATHFVADEFVRTRNMLEAIATGKPVVTHLWLESCGEANCLIDEKNYILRDARKEREFGFSLPVSLSRACQHPLLQGTKVFVTPNTKPGKDILANLVKAVHGLAVERLGRSVLKDEKLPDDLLILSCEEDYEVCVPFLEKGGAVYSSELLLNGIVKQKLEYERHRLFADRVKRTRSTIWVKKQNKYQSVTKS